MKWTRELKIDYAAPDGNDDAGEGSIRSNSLPLLRQKLVSIRILFYNFLFLSSSHSVSFFFWSDCCMHWSNWTQFSFFLHFDNFSFDGNGIHSKKKAFDSFCSFHVWTRNDFIGGYKCRICRTASTVHNTFLDVYIRNCTHHHANHTNRWSFSIRKI